MYNSLLLINYKCYNKFILWYRKEMSGIELYRSCFYGRNPPNFNTSWNWTVASEEIPIQTETDSQSGHILFYARSSFY